MGLARVASLAMIVAFACCKKHAPAAQTQTSASASASASAAPAAANQLASCAILTVTLAQDRSTLYFAEDVGTGGRLTAVPKRGGDERVLYEGADPIGVVAPSGQTIFVTKRTTEGGVFKVEGGALVAVPIEAPAGPHEAFHNVQTGAQVLAFDAGFDRMAVDATSIFVTGSMRGEVGKAPRDGGKLEVLARENGVTGLAIDAANVYFTTVDGAVRRVPKAGGPVTTLASGRTSPHDVVVSGNTVGWLEGTLASSQAFILGVSGAPEQLAVPAGARDSSHLELVAGDAFFLSYDQYGLARVARAPIASNGPATIVPGPFVPSLYVVDGRSLYYVGLVRAPGDPTGMVGSAPLP